VGAGVETEASSAVARERGTDVAILSAMETLSVAVGGVIECEGPGAWH
jgi:hypothetical protein